MKAGSKVSRMNPASVVDRKRGLKPLHPGEMLREDFLIPLGMTAGMLAEEIKVPERRVVAIVKERRSLDADLCLRLARFFRMTPEFWMNLEKDYELETASAEWPRICKEVARHPHDRKIGELKPLRRTRVCGVARRKATAGPSTPAAAATSAQDDRSAERRLHSQSARRSRDAQKIEFR
jgi:addiction module HigA family antidote